MSANRWANHSRAAPRPPSTTALHLKSGASTPQSDSYPDPYTPLPDEGATEYFRLLLYAEEARKFCSENLGCIATLTKDDRPFTRPRRWKLLSRYPSPGISLDAFEIFNLEELSEGVGRPRSTTREKKSQRPNQVRIPVVMLFSSQITSNRSELGLDTRIGLPLGIIQKLRFEHTLELFSCVSLEHTTSVQKLFHLLRVSFQCEIDRKPYEVLRS